MKKLWFLLLIPLIGSWLLFKPHTAPVVPKQPQVTQEPVEPPETLPEASELLVLTNKERVAAGVGELILSQALNQSATDKCADMQARNYWGHDAPDGTTPWYFIRRYTTYLHAGENLAKDFATSDGVVKGWMRSTGHRENLLATKYAYVGFAVCDGVLDNLVVQHFSG